MAAFGDHLETAEEALVSSARVRMSLIVLFERKKNKTSISKSR